MYCGNVSMLLSVCLSESSKFNVYSGYGILWALGLAKMVQVFNRLLFCFLVFINIILETKLKFPLLLLYKCLLSTQVRSGLGEVGEGARECFQF